MPDDFQAESPEPPRPLNQPSSYDRFAAVDLRKPGQAPARRWAIAVLVGGGLIALVLVGVLAWQGAALAVKAGSGIASPSPAAQVAPVERAAEERRRAQPKAKATAKEVEEEIGQLANAARQEVGIAQLNLHPKLTDIARTVAKRTAAQQPQPTEQWMEEQFKLSGYGIPVMRYGVRAGFCQGIEGRPLSVPESFAAWLKEDRGVPKQEERGILNPYFADLGVGVFLDNETGVYYFGLVFAKRFKK
jgi:hypothetical protein